MLSVDELVAEAETWIGTPIRRSGSTKGVRCNCLGMCAGVARDLGLTEAWEAFAPYEGHQLPPSPFFLIRSLRKHLNRVAGVRKRGHLVLINTENNRPDATHVALCAQPFLLIDPGGRSVHKRRVTRDIKIIEWYEIPGVKYD